MTAAGGWTPEYSGTWRYANGSSSYLRVSQSRMLPSPICASIAA